ncbi:putative diacylglycerol acyltransferase, partial [Trypanosoma conorhini]
MAAGRQDGGPTPLAPAAAYVVEPTTTAEMHELLDLILHACEHLQDLIRDRHPVTQREVAKLRKSYWLAVGETGRLRSRSVPVDSLASPTDSSRSSSAGTEDSRRQDAKAVACDCALGELEEYVRPRPEAHTFDLDDADCEGGERRVWHFFSIPLERRLQTLSVSLFLFFTFIPAAVLVTLALLLSWTTMPLMLAYLVYIFTLGRPKHPLKKCVAFTRHRLWGLYRNYFPVRLVIPRHVRAKFDPQANYFFIYHPHGIHSFGAIATFSLDFTLSSLLPGITVHVQTLKLNFFIPFWRELHR